MDFVGKIYVGVPHDVNVYVDCEFRKEVRKYVGGHLVATLKRGENPILNARIESREREPLFGIIPDFDKEIVDCDQYPEGYEIVVVSALYASAYRRKFGKIPNSLRVVTDPVVDDNGNIVGCRGLAPLF